MKQMIGFSNCQSTGSGTRTHRRARQIQKTGRKGKICQNPVCHRMTVVDGGYHLNTLLGALNVRRMYNAGSKAEILGPDQTRKSGCGMSTELFLKQTVGWGKLCVARAHGMWTYEPRQGRNAATVVCSASAVVTLAFF
jgi:hypothetical protein